MRKHASPAPVEIQTDSSMLEIHMQGVYSLLQLAIVFTCQLLPNKVVTCSDVRHPRPPLGCPRVDGEAVRWRLAVTTGRRPRRPPLQPWGGVAVRFLCPVEAVWQGLPTLPDHCFEHKKMCL
jgi:hypothetical protein